MLILSRKVGEKIVLPDLNVVLTVCQISRSNVRLGVSAPAAVPVYRQELYERLEGPEHETATRLGEHAKNDVVAGQPS